MLRRVTRVLAPKKMRIIDLYLEWWSLTMPPFNAMVILRSTKLSKHQVNYERLSQINELGESHQL